LAYLCCYARKEEAFLSKLAPSKPCKSVPEQLVSGPEFGLGRAAHHALLNLSCCCARATSGIRTAAPPISVMKSHRRIERPRRTTFSLGYQIVAPQSVGMKANLQPAESPMVGFGSWSCENFGAFLESRIFASGSWMPKPQTLATPSRKPRQRIQFLEKYAKGRFHTARVNRVNSTA